MNTNPVSTLTNSNNMAAISRPEAAPASGQQSFEQLYAQRKMEQRPVEKPKEPTPERSPERPAECNKSPAAANHQANKQTQQTNKAQQQEQQASNSTTASAATTEASTDTGALAVAQSSTEAVATKDVTLEGEGQKTQLSAENLAALAANTATTANTAAATNTVVAANPDITASPMILTQAATQVITDDLADKASSDVLDSGKNSKGVLAALLTQTNDKAKSSSTGKDGDGNELASFTDAMGKKPAPEVHQSFMARLNASASSPQTLFENITQQRQLVSKEHSDIITSDNSTQNTALQPGQMNNSAATVKSAPSLAMQTPFGQAGWTEELNQKVMFLGGHKGGSAELILNPANLGRIEININLNGDQTSAHFASQHAGVRQALEEAMPRLREMFAAAGLSLGETNVGQQQQSGNGQRSGSQGRASIADKTLTELNNGPVIRIPAAKLGLVDTFV